VAAAPPYKLCYTNETLNPFVLRSYLFGRCPESAPAVPFAYGGDCSVLEEEEEHWYVKLGGGDAEGGNGEIVHSVDWKSVV
jgi:hypothetical protein